MHGQPRWSLSQMRRLLQQSLIAGAVFVGGALWCLALPAVEAEADKDQPAAKEPKDFKAYKDTIPAAGDEAAVDFEVVPIAGGTFTMGSPDTEKGRNKDEGPQHQVTLKPFWMGKTHVTWD